MIETVSPSSLAITHLSLELPISLPLSLPLSSPHLHTPYHTFNMSQNTDIKRLILCCDGTWQASNTGKGGAVATNVTKFCVALNPTAKLPDNREIQQVIYYQPGVGSTTISNIGKAVAGGTGLGLDRNVVAAYSFLINNYDEGDEIFCFGFSRGAYTARCIAGLVSDLGILSKEALPELAEIYNRYRTLREKGENTDEWIHYLSGIRKGYALNNDGGIREPNIKICGVWDTVGALGIPQTSYAGAWDSKHKFHNPRLSDKIENAFHALALDEHRAPFSPTLWHKNANSKTNLIQCWFPGVHSNVGGSTDLGKGIHGETLGVEPLADDSLAWMIDLCSPYLSFNEAHLGRLAYKIQYDQQKRADEGHRSIEAQYASVIFEDSYGWSETPMGSIRRAPGQYDETNQLGNGQHISGFDTTCEYMHVSVRYRYQNLREAWGWNRNQLSNWETVKKWAMWSGADPLFELAVDEKADARCHRSGYKWIKKLQNGKVVELPEMKLGNTGTVPAGYSFEERLVPDAVLKKIKAGEKTLVVA